MGRVANPGGVALSPQEEAMLAAIRRKPGPRPGILSDEEKLVGLEDQLQRAWRRLAHAVRATHDHDAVIAMNHFHSALEALYGSGL